MIRRILAALGRKPYIYKLWQTRELLIFLADRRAHHVATWSEPFEKNSLASLSLFTSEERWQDREEFLSQAESRINAGGMVSTLVKGDKLIAWSFAAPSSKSYLPWVDQEVEYPPRSASLLSGYVSACARGQGIHGQQQNFRIHHMLLEFDYVFGFVQGNNPAAVKAAQKSAMRHVATLQTRWRFFVPIKRVILFGTEVPISFREIVYTSDGTYQSACEVHDGVTVVT